MRAILGVIGGSGFYELPGVEKIEELNIESPWGRPSDRLKRGEINGKPVVFLSRHGRGHTLSPSEINYRANIDCMKRAGVTDLVSLAACGSFRQDIAPGHFVLVDQFVDRTFQRPTSFFGSGCVAHVSMAHPIGPKLADRLERAAKAENISYTKGGTYVCVEGPQFTTKAESLAYAAEGWTVIGMTGMPEAKLAREAEITYATVAMVTDYDNWHDEQVDVPMVLRVLKENSAKASRLVIRLAKEFPEAREDCPAGSDRALEFAIVTPSEHRDPVLMKKLDAIAGRVLQRST